MVGLSLQSLGEEHGALGTLGIGGGRIFLSVGLTAGLTSHGNDIALIPVIASACRDWLALILPLIQTSHV